MRLKIATTLIVLMATLGSAMAQDTIEEQSRYYSSNPNQWFVGAGVGAQIYISYDNSRYGLDKVITPAFSANFGKMFNRKYGVRAQVTGYQVVMFTDYNRYNTNGTHYFQKYKHNYVSINADFYMNLSNTLWPKTDSRWNWTAFAGPGIAFASPNVDRLESLVNVSAGMGVKYQVTKSLSIDMEGRYMVTSSLFLNQGRSSIDGIGMLTAGVTYSFGGSKPKCAYKEKYVSAYTQSIAKSRTITEQKAALANKEKELQSTQNQLADKTNQLAECNKAKSASKYKAIAPAPVKAAETTSTPSSTVIATVYETLKFQPNSAKLSDAHYTLIEKVAERLQKDPEAKIAVISYGDYSPKMKLSESALLSFQRANNIVSALKEKYKVDARRIRFVNKGDNDKSSQHLAYTVLILDDNN